MIISREPTIEEQLAKEKALGYVSLDEISHQEALDLWYDLKNKVKQDIDRIKRRTIRYVRTISKDI